MKVSYTVEEVSLATGICKTNIYSLLKQGKIVGRKFGRKTLVPKAELEKFISSLETYSINSGGEDVR